MPANIRETLVGWGFRKQTDIATANVLAGIWRLNKLNAALSDTRLNTEDDAAELGKGHEFATQVFKTSWDVSGQIEKYLSSDLAAWVFSFALGKSVKSGLSPNFTYTITPLSPPTDGIELPYFSFIEQIRPGASDVLDRMAVGCAVEGLTLQVGSGPGRANSKLTVDFVGSGKLTEPSAITLPAPTVEKLLPAASVALTINGTNYVSSKRIVSLEMTWRNNLRLDAGFFPGSGFQTPGDGASGAIRGRLECGDRIATLNFTARFEDGSDELTKLKNQTTGTATIQLTFDADNDLLITFHQLSFKVATVNETDGLVTVAVECQPQYHATNGLLTAVAKCNTDNIGQ